MNGFDASANKFSARQALQKCSPRSFLKVKFTEDTWRIQFLEHEDHDLFVEVLTRGVSFQGQCLRARNRVFLYTPKELWEEVERLADATNQNYHEGLGGGKNSQHSTQGGAIRSNKSE